MAAVEAPAAPPPELVLTGNWTTPRALLASLVRSRGLCVTLARKDFFVRYRRAVLGVFWAAALPVIQALVLAIVLRHVTRVDVPHYAVFVFAGITMWTYFLAAMTAGTTAIVDNSPLCSRIYFPRAVLPLAACVSNLFTLVTAGGLLLIASLASGVRPDLHLLLAVPAAIMIVLVTAGLTLVVSALHVYFRDMRYLVQAALFLWFYVTPVFYPLTLLHGATRKLVEINPLTAPVQLLQAAAVRHVDLSATAITSTLVCSLVLLGAALVLHCRHDRTFADLL